MRLSHGIAAVVAFLVMSLPGRSVRADSITSLYNTGVDNSHTVLTDGTIGDPHYTLVSVPSDATQIRIRTSVGGFPIGPYLGDDSLSTWIGPNNDSSLDGPFGSYDYRTTFSLVGLNAATASISGQWATDNNGIDILLNGVSQGFTTPFQDFVFHTFTISNGFLAGINTLDFVVNNGSNSDNPTALRVEMIGSAAAVPLPTTAWVGLILFGGLGVVYGVRRKNFVIA